MLDGNAHVCATCNEEGRRQKRKRDELGECVSQVLAELHAVFIATQHAVGTAEVGSAV